MIAKKNENYCIKAVIFTSIVDLWLNSPDNITRQIHRTAEYCENNLFEIDNVYISGGMQKTDQLFNMLRYLEKQRDTTAVVVDSIEQILPNDPEKVSRLTFWYMKGKVQIHAIKENLVLCDFINDINSGVFKKFCEAMAKCCPSYSETIAGVCNKEEQHA